MRNLLGTAQRAFLVNSESRPPEPVFMVALE
jgi:hypothetical protein